MRTFMLVVMAALAAPSAAFASAARRTPASTLAGFAPNQPPSGYPRDLPYLPGRSVPVPSLAVGRTGLRVGVEYQRGASILRDDFLGALKAAGWTIASRSGDWTLIRKDSMGEQGVWSFRVVTVRRRSAGPRRASERLELRWNRPGREALDPALIPEGRPSAIATR